MATAFHPVSRSSILKGCSILSMARILSIVIVIIISETLAFSLNFALGGRAIFNYDKTRAFPSLKI